MDIERLCVNCMADTGGLRKCPECGWQKGDGGSSSLHIGQGNVLAGKYLVGRVLGQGGFGITYLAWDLNLDIKIAIKEYFPSGLVGRVPGSNEVTAYKNGANDYYVFGLDKFSREAKTLAKFADNPNMVNVRDFFQENGTAYMVMNYIEGLTLEEYLQKSGGRISFDKALQIMMPVMDALKVVHDAQIMHRDISPDNIFISTDGRVFLIDFGAARQEMRENSKSVSVLVKAGYAPEEQYRSMGRQGPWTDIYALAATVYRAITGKVPVESLDRLAGDTLAKPSELGVDIPEEAELFLMKAMSVRAEKRQQNMGRFQEDLLRRQQVFAEQVTARNGGMAAAADRLMLNSGTAPALIPVTELSVGTRLVDKGWGWEFRGGPDMWNGLPYSGRGVVKPVVWIVVAKNHYSGSDAGKVVTGAAHLTLLSEELICRYPFHRADNPVNTVGRNHWGSCGSDIAVAGSNVKKVYGVRKFLNGSIYRGRDNNHYQPSLFDSMSEHFQHSILLTSVPNKDWESGNIYSTTDKIFLPSTTELADLTGSYTYPVGANWGYFSNDGSRIAFINGSRCWYYTRSPSASNDNRVRCVGQDGAFGYASARSAAGGIRPVLNISLEEDITVYRNSEGIFEIVW